MTLNESLLAGWERRWGSSSSSRAGGTPSRRGAGRSCRSRASTTSTPTRSSSRSRPTPAVSTHFFPVCRSEPNALHAASVPNEVKQDLLQRIREIVQEESESLGWPHPAALFVRKRKKKIKAKEEGIKTRLALHLHYISVHLGDRSRTFVAFTRALHGAPPPRRKTPGWRIIRARCARSHGPRRRAIHQVTPGGKRTHLAASAGASQVSPFTRENSQRDTERDRNKNTVELLRSQCSINLVPNTFSHSSPSNHSTFIQRPFNHSVNHSTFKTTVTRITRVTLFLIPQNSFFTHLNIHFNRILNIYHLNLT